MVDYLSQPPAELVRPDLVFYDYTNGIFKVVKHKFPARLRVYVNRGEFQHYDKKLDSSLSRTRRTILELGLCNNWEYFCTFTIAEKNFYRKDLSTWHDKFMDWLRYQRKKYKALGIEFKFVLVPELHKDGSWHMHGLFSDITPVLTSFQDLADRGENVPYKLVKGGYFNWLDYQEKFGFCSFGKIKNKVACGFYITKYITKDLQDAAIGVGLHRYYPSRPLNRAKKHGEIYGQCSAFDKYLTNHYDFCDTGMTSVKDGCDWTFGLEYMDFDMLEAVSFSDPVEAPEVDTYFEAVQQVLDGF